MRSREILICVLSAVLGGLGLTACPATESKADEPPSVHAMACERVADGRVFRCENDEVVCYTYTRGYDSAAIACPVVK